MARTRRIGELELIARYFAPLARGFKGAGGLKSDNAFIDADAKHDLVVKTDTIVSGVHFLVDEKPEFVAAKALRVCLSDLAAGGATPFAYQLSLSLSMGWKESWVAGFVRGLAADQRRYGILLCAGDSRVRLLKSVSGNHSPARRWVRFSSASPRQQPMSPMACWPMPATSAKLRGLAS